MPAYAQPKDMMRPRERAYALAAVAFVQLALAIILLRGFHVDLVRSGEVIQRLVDVTLAKPPPPPPEPVKPKPQHQQAAAPKAEPVKSGGTPGPRPAHAPPS